MHEDVPPSVPSATDQATSCDRKCLPRSTINSDDSPFICDEECPRSARASVLDFASYALATELYNRILN